MEGDKVVVHIEENALSMRDGRDVLVSVNSVEDVHLLVDALLNWLEENKEEACTS